MSQEEQCLGSQDEQCLGSQEEQCLRFQEGQCLASQHFAISEGTIGHCPGACFGSRIIATGSPEGHLKQNFDTKPFGYLPAPRKSTFDPNIQKITEIRRKSSNFFCLPEQSQVSGCDIFQIVVGF